MWVTLLQVKLQFWLNIQWISNNSTDILFTDTTATTPIDDYDNVDSNKNTNSINYLSW